MMMAMCDGKLIEIDLSGERLLGRTRRQPRQQLVKRHHDPSKRPNPEFISSPPEPTRARRPAPSAPRWRRSPAASRGPRSGSRRPAPTSTSVPAMARTMCRRKPSAATSKAINRPPGTASAGSGDGRRVGDVADRRLGHGPDGVGHVGAGGLERREIVRARSAIGPPAPWRRHPGGPGTLPDVAGGKRADERPVHEAVAIALAPRGEARMKVAGDVLDALDTARRPAAARSAPAGASRCPNRS